MTQRALITGGAGFIGSHVADLFIAEGFGVEIIDDLTSGKHANLPEAARFHEISVTSPEAAAIVRDGRFDIIVHLAAQIDVRKSVADPVHDARTNIIGTVNLLEAIRASGHKTRVAFTSTGGAIYGDFNTPPNVETFQKDPESPYAISKLSAEYYLAYYGRIHGIEHVAMRFGNVYGPRQDPHGEAGVVAIFCTRILDGKPLTIFGDGLQTRDYVYVGDVARAVFLGATRAIPPAERVDARAFNVGTGVGTSVVDLARLLQEAAGSSTEIVFAPKRPGEQQESFLDAAKARSLLGWDPKVSLSEGLARTFAWAAEQNAAEPA
ncbi:MAG TPA: NAD-dependent epimerase/dehydratase family protein [Gemmatimonadaceae bacterium]|nr:NAD-dependent epimerase/dehydratase family protein [Gemmatimonadaceae bacterium]